jgi:hypothetical protein
MPRKASPKDTPGQASRISRTKMASKKAKIPESSSKASKTSLAQMNLPKKTSSKDGTSQKPTAKKILTRTQNQEINWMVTQQASYFTKPAYTRTLEDRYEIGRKLRLKCPRNAHADLNLPSTRKNPVDILIESGRTRVQSLLPIRYGRMSISPFTFYRGAAAIMAADLANTPTTGYIVQSCGDCHLANFGAFGTAEHEVFFDINDFDESYPAPWEWDLKRLTASFVIACQNNNFKSNDTRKIVRYLVKCYNKQLHALAAMPVLDAWSYVYEFDELVAQANDPKFRKAALRTEQKAKGVTGLKEYSKLAHVIDDQPRIADQPPVIFHFDEQKTKEFKNIAEHALKLYKRTLPMERRILLDRYEYMDMAMKVVGVGSVGTFCAIALFFAGEEDPLFLQIKEANQSVLEPYQSVRLTFADQGERIIYGQHIMQVASDIFLGHFKGELGDAVGRDFYVRKLHNVKISFDTDTFSLKDMKDYARYCALALARAHARSGDPAIIAGYIGNKGGEFADALVDFSFAYADLNRQDHQQLLNAIKSGKIKAIMEES